MTDAGSQRLAALAQAAEALARAPRAVEGIRAMLAALVSDGALSAGALFLGADGAEPALAVAEPAAWDPSADPAAKEIASLLDAGTGPELHGGVLVVPLVSGEERLGGLLLSPPERRDGDWLPFARALGASVGAAAALAVARDRALALEDRVRHDARHDPLTGLPNQVAFAEALEASLKEAEDAGSMVAVLFLDVDRFRNINDTLGHALGDRLLKLLSERLVAAGSSSGAGVYRMAGDEFLVLMPALKHAKDAGRFARDVRDALKEPFDCEGHELFISGSLGIAVYPYDGDDAQALVKNADAAMYRAKERGGDDFQFYTPAMYWTAFRRLSLETSLRRALDREEFTVHYQPLVRTDSSTITGVEVLVRWEHPDLGTVAPARFLWLAEETGLIVPIGEWVLRTACAQARRWRDGGLAVGRMSVNLAARQIDQPDLLACVDRVLDSTKLDPTVLGVEITESVAMRDPLATVSLLRALRDRGVRASLDDFGTGHSSLTYLKTFPIDTLKLDQSFVRGVPFARSDAAIVSAVIALAHALQLNVVAEGVETEEQRTFLSAHGCDELQGYLFSKPLPADGCAALLVPA